MYVVWLGLEFGEKRLGGSKVASGAPIYFDRQTFFDSINCSITYLSLFSCLILVFILIWNFHKGHDISFKESNFRVIFFLKLTSGKL